MRIVKLGGVFGCWVMAMVISAPVARGAWTWVEFRPQGDRNGNWDQIVITSNAQFVVAGTHAGSYGGVFYSSNSGSAWTEVRTLNSQYEIVTCSDDGQRLVAAGFGSSFNISTNGGASWTAKYPTGTGGNHNWTCGAASGDGLTIYAALGLLEYGLYRSTDGGENWTALTPTGTATSWYGLAASRSGETVVSGNTGHFFISDDYGANWTERLPAGGPITGTWYYAAVSDDGQRIFAGYTQPVFVQNKGYLYLSTNGGAAWTLINPAAPDTAEREWYSLAMSGDGQVMMAGEVRGRLYLSTNSGAAWTVIDPTETGGTFDWDGCAVSGDGRMLGAGQYNGSLYLTTVPQPVTDTLTPAAAGSSIWNVNLGSYEPTTAYVMAGYDSFGNPKSYRGTMEFDLADYTTAVSSAALQLVVQSQSAASNYWYQLYAFSQEGNGAVNGYDYTNIAATAIVTLYSNELPIAGTTNLLDVTDAFNRAVSNGWRYLGLHTVQTPEQTTGSELQHHAFGASQPVLWVTHEGEAPALPKAPSGVTATDGTFTDRVEVAWNPAAHADKYIIFRHTGVNPSSASIIGESASTNFTDTTGEAQQEYYYWVRATNALGYSPYSAYDTGLRRGEVNLEIRSAYGVPMPPVGTHTYYTGSNINCAVSGSPITGSGTQYVCTGWSMPDNWPESGSTTNTGSFSITNNAVLDWLWTTNVLLAFQTNGNGAIEGSAGGWLAFGGSVTVTAVPASSDFVFDGWSGDVEAGMGSQNPLAITNDRARTITAHFIPYEIGTVTDVVAAAAAGSSIWNVNLGSYEPSTAYVLAGYDPFGSPKAYRGTMEFDLNAYTAAVISASVQLVVQSQLAASNYWYQLHAFANEGNGAVNGYDYTNIASAAIGTIYSNDLPVAGTTNLLDVTADFNRAVSNGWRYFGLHTTQFPEQTTGSELKHYSSGDVQPRLVIVRRGEVVALEIQSPYGSPHPPAGVGSYPKGAALACDVSGSPVTIGATQYVCAGWSMSGNEPASGATTNTGSFTLTNHAVLAWRWTTNVFLTLHTNGNGEIQGTASGWQSLGAVVSATAAPGSGYDFAGWSGDVPAAMTNDNPLAITNDMAREITAHFQAGTPVEPPEAPAEVWATDGIYTGHVVVAWTPSAAATGYEVYRHTIRDSASAQYLGAVAGAAYLDASALGDVVYYYWAKATNQAGASAFSPPDTGYASAAPVHYVDINNAAPAWPYMAWSAAATSIQEAVDAAAPGSVVLVSNGTYTLAQSLVITNGVTLRSVNGPTNTIVDAAYAGFRCITISNCHATVEGFLVRRGFDWSVAGGIYCVSGLVRDCIIINNIVSNTFALGGGGVYCEHSRIENCRIANNRVLGGGSGGGVRATASTVDRCDVFLNFAANYGGGVWAMDTSLVVNCVIYTNRAGFYGGGVATRYAGNVVRNCTIADNYALWNGGGIFCWDGGAFENCIIYDNSFENFYLSSGAATWKASCITPSPDPVCITNPPAFVNPPGFDYSLAADSPCMDAGEPVPLAYDRNGLERPLDGDNNGAAAWDMGAFEYLNTAADSDRDGLSDTNELAIGTRLSLADSDGDYMGDGDEVAAGTGPLNSNSYLAAETPFNEMGGQGLIIRWLSVAGKKYRMERASNLWAHIQFNAIATNLQGLAGFTSYTDTTATGVSPGFYRISVEP